MYKQSKPPLVAEHAFPLTAFVCKEAHVTPTFAKLITSLYIFGNVLLKSGFSFNCLEQLLYLSVDVSYTRPRDITTVGDSPLRVIHSLLVCHIPLCEMDILYIVDLDKVKHHMSLVVRKPAFCIFENKDADQLRGKRLCFRYTDSTIPLLLKSEISNPLAIFCGYTARFVSDLVGNPEDWFSHNEDHIVKLGFTVLTYYFLFSLLMNRLWVLVRNASSMF